LPHVSAQESWPESSEIGLERARGKRESGRRAISCPMRSVSVRGGEVKEIALRKAVGWVYLGEHGDA
jgi:hypothetical protein